jgi:putative thioredoxin
MVRALLARVTGKDSQPADAAVASRAALLGAELLLEAGRADEVEPLLGNVDPRGDAVERADALRELLALHRDAVSFGGEAQARAAIARDDGDLEARWALAGALVGRAGFAGALESLLDIVTRSRRFRDDGARRAMLAVFRWLGGGGELEREYRRRLQVVT